MKSRLIAMTRLLTVAGLLALCTAARGGQVLTNFKDEYQDETPNAGWKYQWNADMVDSVASYTDLAFQAETKAYVVDAGEEAQGGPKGPYIRKDGAHPGPPKAGGGTNCIYTYTLQAGQGGHIRLEDTVIRRLDQDHPGDIEVRVRVNDTVSEPISVQDSGNFDRDLGELKDGDVISVLVGPGDTDFCDLFKINYSIVKE